MKKEFNLNFLLGLGLGLLLASFLILLAPPKRLTDYQVQERARSMGMVYPEEVLKFPLEKEALSRQAEEAQAD